MSTTRITYSPEYNHAETIIIIDNKKKFQIEGCNVTKLLIKHKLTCNNIICPYSVKPLLHCRHYVKCWPITHALVAGAATFTLNFVLIENLWCKK